MNRYQRQILLPQLGEAGQVRLSGSGVLIVGCGALGTVITEQLARNH
jgi:molybdopterin-synthase adenylyltransferase